MLRAFLELLGLVEAEDTELEEEYFQDEQEERKQRFMSSPVGQASVVICRQDKCLLYREELAQALRSGQVIIADLRKMEKEEGQGILDFLCGVAYTIHGSVSRLCPGVFIVSPRRTLVEEWEEPGDEDLESRHSFTEGVEDIERTSHGS